MRVLLIEDDAGTVAIIEQPLRKQNFQVYTTDLGEEGVNLAKLYDYDIILLDSDLQDMSGYETLRRLRTAKVKAPILILSSRLSVEDKVEGLNLGADDYMTKPFHKDELVARMHAIIRRSMGHADSTIQVDDLIVNVSTKTVQVNGMDIPLTRKEYLLIEALSLNLGKKVSRGRLLDHLYDYTEGPDQRGIDVWVGRIRKKIMVASKGRNYIQAVWGYGYILK